MANVKNVSESVIKGLDFCFYKLIPSLYPFMVLSSTMLYTTRISGSFRILNFILDNCKIYADEIIMGCICGFVIGAKGICNKFNKGVSINDFNRGIFFSSNAGIGFVIGCIGCSVFNDVTFGIYLYVVQILSGYILFKITFDGRKNILFYNENFQKNNVSDVLVKSIKSSTNTILTICGFSVFFSIIIDLITSIFQSNSNLIIVIVTILLDFSKGVFTILNVLNLELRGVLAGFCIGFGGVCVYMQICSECEGYPFKKLKFILLKFCQGVMCGAFSLLYFEFFKFF